MYSCEEEMQDAMQAEAEADANNMALIGHAIECLREEIEEVKDEAHCKIADLESEIVNLENMA